MRHFVHLPLLVILGFTAVCLVALQGCCRTSECMAELYGIELAGEGGGQDSVTITMPFTSGYTSTCVQGVGGSYSHRYTSTLYDADFDTPNNEDVPVYAPASGVAYVHDNTSSGFGRHINIDLGDGTYVLMAHLADIFVDDKSEVAEGQLLGFEGTTGNSTGDHVHIGRHDGDPAEDAGKGESIEGIVFRTTEGDLAVTDLACSLTSGTAYTSTLDTPHWHPNGSLVKTPESATVYLLNGGTRRAFYDEDAFFSRGYAFDDVALIDNDELDCYSVGGNIALTNEISAVYESGGVWLVFAGDREKQRVGSVAWQAVLKSYGITASTYDDLPSDTDLRAFDDIGGTAMFRDGTLVSEASSSAVYVIADETAMPIMSWDVLLLMGFEDRAVLEVDDGVVASVMSRIGSCATNAYCVSWEDVVTCGGPASEDEGTFTADASADAAGFTLTWTTPGSVPADRIALSGEYMLASGSSTGWQTLASAAGLASLTYSVIDAASGDALRFSTEYTVGGVTSWSCLAPFPPGTVQGTVAAAFNGTALNVSATDDPSSNGCGLSVTMP